MADFSILKQQIAAALPENTEGEITATIMVAQFWAAIDAINAAKADQGDLESLAGVVAGKMRAFGLDEYGGLKWITDGDATDLSVDFEQVQAAIPDLSEIRQNAASPPLRWLTGEAQQVEEGRVYTGTGILAAPGEFDVIKCYAVNYTDTAQTITCWRYPDTGSNAQTFTLAPFQVLALTCTIDEPQGSIWTAADSHYQRENEIFWATYGTTTAAEIEAASNAGKIVLCDYSGKIYTASASDSDYLYLGWGFGIRAWCIRVDRSTNEWNLYASYNLQSAGDRITAAPTASDLASTSRYPSMAALADALGKWGVISQKQTWTSDYHSYTISDQKYGIIPREFIDRWLSLVFNYGTFNEATGYFELNGLTDISYKEALDIADRYTISLQAEGWRPNSLDASNYYTARTSIPCSVMAGTASPYLTWNTYIEETRFVRRPPVNTEFSALISYGCYRLKKMWDVYAITNTDLNLVFFYALEEFYFKLSKNFSAVHSKYISLASIVYMVDNATNTSPVTYTLHANAYARCSADTTEYTYNGQTYTGIIAYAAAKDISIVSA